MIQNKAIPISPNSYMACFRSIIDNASEAIIFVNDFEEITFFNKGAETIFGYLMEEIYGKQLSLLFSNLSKDVQTNKVIVCLQSKEKNFLGKTADSIGVRKDGREFPLEVSLTDWDSEQGHFVTLIARDVSERSHLQSQIFQAQKLESIGQLAAGIAHELNTPIQYVGDNTKFLKESFKSLKGLLDQYSYLVKAIKEGKSADPIIKKIEDMEESIDLEYLKNDIPVAFEHTLEGIENVANIVRAMKEFSHPGTKEKVAVDINKAIANTITISRNEWKYMAKVITDFDPALPLVHCLPSEFNQVILNLIINAADAIAELPEDDKREKTITVSTRQEGPRIEIRVSDTGTGIPQKIKERIFDPFFTTKEVGKGTGQGLAISRSVIVDKHGGTIECETEVGKGTTFIIRLPIIEGNQIKR